LAATQNKDVSFIHSFTHVCNQSINQYYFIAAWQNAGPQFAQIKKNSSFSALMVSAWQPEGHRACKTSAFNTVER